MKKFTWGHGIFAFYVVFVITMMSVLYASTKVDRGLVMDDYYSLDLAYQARYDEIDNGNNDEGTAIDYDAQAQKINVHFPVGVKGEIKMYRPSDQSMDFQQKIVQSNESVDTGEMAKGLWIIKLFYSVNKDNFYKETKIYL